MVISLRYGTRYEPRDVSNQEDLDRHWTLAESEPANHNPIGAGLLKACEAGAGKRLHPISEIPVRVSGHGALVDELMGGYDRNLAAVRLRQRFAATLKRAAPMKTSLNWITMDFCLISARPDSHWSFLRSKYL